jgi:hypothetical protein
MTESPERVVERYLEAERGTLQVIGRAGRTWDVLVPSYWKESVAVSLALSDRILRAEAFFMRSPDENHELVYRLLLARNARAHLWKFTVNEAGDASLVAEVPILSLDPDGLDLLFGTLVTLVDETYPAYLRVGFAAALDEQVRVGGPGLDQPPPWAGEWEAAPDSAMNSGDTSP